MTVPPEEKKENDKTSQKYQIIRSRRRVIVGLVPTCLHTTIDDFSGNCAQLFRKVFKTSSLALVRERIVYAVRQRTHLYPQIQFVSIDDATTHLIHSLSSV